MTQAPGRLPGPRTPAVDDLAVLLPDRRTHLRARNVAPSTSYLKAGDNLLSWLGEAGMPATASRITRDHLEGSLAIVTVMEV